MNRGGRLVHAVRRETYDAVCGVEEEADGGTSRGVRKLINPQRPSQQEVDAHELTHLPSRNRCRHCVLGRGRETPHRNGKDKELSMPEVHWDFMFLGEEKDPGNAVAIIVAKEKRRRWGCRRWSLTSPPGTSYADEQWHT